MGGLGCEQTFIDGSLYQRYIVIDSGDNPPNAEFKTIHSKFSCLPIQSESVDMVIMPHSLEFEDDQHQALREIDRVLKPEAILIIINFNPWSYWVRYRFLLAYAKSDPLMKAFIRRSKIIDWLKLLNFEIGGGAEFSFKAAGNQYRRNTKSPMVISYAVRALKRRYHIIPLTQAKTFKTRLSLAGAIETNRSLKK
jgi:SAM-dependent methyltransferase